MSISDGQSVNATVTNSAFMSRTQNTSTVGKVDLSNTDSASGALVVNEQRETNSLNAFTGRPSGSAHNASPAWTNTDVGTGTDTLKARDESLTFKFNDTSGHTHTGVPGDAPKIDANTLSNIPLEGDKREGTLISGVTGNSSNISAQFLIKLVSTSGSTPGVPSTAPTNRVLIYDNVTRQKFTDGSGNEVYGRTTNTGGTGGTWTLAYYSILASVETAYSFGVATDVWFFFQDLMGILVPTGNPYDELLFVPSDDAIAIVPEASVSTAGIVSIGIQSFGGEKNFDSGFATEKQDIASAATITSLSSTKSFVRITGATATALQGVTAPASGQNKRLLIHNVASSDVTLKHQNVGASAINRIITPDAADLPVAQNSSIEIIYDDVQSRWVVVSSGSGSGSTVGYPEDIGTGDGVNDTFGPLTFIPLNEDSIWVFVNGLWQSPTDWSLVSTDIIFGAGNEPATDAIVSVHYLTNGVVALPVLPSGAYQSYQHTITAGEITAKQITISPTPASATQVLVNVKGAGSSEFFGDDYTISGAIFDWDTYDLDGILVAGDKIRFTYVT